MSTANPARRRNRVAAFVEARTRRDANQVPGANGAALHSQNEHLEDLAEYLWHVHAALLAKFAEPVIVEGSVSAAVKHQEVPEQVETV